MPSDLAGKVQSADGARWCLQEKDVLVGRTRRGLLDDDDARVAEDTLSIRITSSGFAYETFVNFRKLPLQDIT